MNGVSLHIEPPSYLVHGLKMCILFEDNYQINFCHFFHKMNLVISLTKVNRY